MTSAPSLRPTPVETDRTVTVTVDIVPADLSELRIVDDADLVGATAPLVVPDTPAGAAGPIPAPTRVAGETHAPALVTRLVVMGLLVVSGAVVFSALAHGRTAPTVQTVPTNRSAVTKPVPLPTRVHIVGAQRTGDVIILRVDPVGESGQQNVVVEPGARVVLSRVLGQLPTGVVPLQQFLDAAGTSALRPTDFSLGYDAAGSVRTIEITAAG